uniref:Uncharacterized protein n=1 Tax=Cacopsylla melanoneura TaxID=428564 RepID=A0A8D8VDU4_9HEMI
MDDALFRRVSILGRQTLVMLHKQCVRYPQPHLQFGRDGWQCHHHLDSGSFSTSSPPHTPHFYHNHQHDPPDNKSHYVHQWTTDQFVTDAGRREEGVDQWYHDASPHCSNSSSQRPNPGHFHKSWRGTTYCSTVTTVHVTNSTRRYCPQ